jgi:endonuclease/exonuclease/phosphatase family metal-dependent hydrolase
MTTRLTLLEWNLASALQYSWHARRQMRVIARMLPLPQVVVLVEARGSLYGTYVSALQERTGRSWDGVFQGHCSPGCWDAGNNSCSRHDDEGVMLLSTFPVLARSSTLFPHPDPWHSARAAAHLAIDIDGAEVHVIGTHLQAGIGSGVRQSRLASIAMLTSWAAGFPSPAIVGGDFNALPASEEISSAAAGMAASFVDVWTLVGKGAGGTFPAWWWKGKQRYRIDYWFVDARGTAKTTSAEVITTTKLSDHYPLRVTIEL